MKQTRVKCNKVTCFGLSQQKGVVLVVSLFILLLMTLIGISGMQASGLEEKMAGNSKDRNDAFQAAESALKEAEAQIVTLWNKGSGAVSYFCGNSNRGVFSSVTGCVKAPPDPFGSTTWTNTNNYIAGTNARYFITYINKSAIKAGDAYETYSFLITARGQGGQADTQVLLRSYYNMVAPWN